MKVKRVKFDLIYYFYNCLNVNLLPTNTAIKVYTFMINIESLYLLPFFQGSLKKMFPP